MRPPRRPAACTRAPARPTCVHAPPSQTSEVQRLPSSTQAVPAVRNVHVAVQQSPGVPSAAPSSHCSPGSTIASPQTEPGAEVVYAKAAESALVPPTVTTLTSTVSGASAGGETAVIDPSSFTVNPAGVSPK